MREEPDIKRIIQKIYIINKYKIKNNVHMILVQTLLTYVLKSKNLKFYYIKIKYKFHSMSKHT